MDKKANKVEIKNAVEQFYNVAVESVNTAIMPSKSRTRSTRSGMQRGRKPSYKKAIVTLAYGEDIDLYGEV